MKESCKLAGIDEPIRLTNYEGNQRTDEVKPKYALIGTHTARRTFRCNMLSLGVAADIVMKMDWILCLKCNETVHRHY